MQSTMQRKSYRSMQTAIKASVLETKRDLYCNSGKCRKLRVGGRPCGLVVPQISRAAGILMSSYGRMVRANCTGTRLRPETDSMTCMKAEIEPGEKSVFRLRR